MDIIRSPNALLDSLRNFKKWLPPNVGATDIDCFIERHSHFLIIESTDRPNLTLGKFIALKNLAIACPNMLVLLTYATTTWELDVQVFVVNILDVPNSETVVEDNEKRVVIDWSKGRSMFVSELRAFIATWFEKATNGETYDFVCE